MPERPPAHSIERDTSEGVAAVRLTCRECLEAGFADGLLQRAQYDTTGEWDEVCREFLKTHPIPFQPAREFRLTSEGRGYKIWSTPDGRWLMYSDRETRDGVRLTFRMLTDFLTHRMWEPESYNEALQIIRRNTEAL